MTSPDPAGAHDSLRQKELWSDPDAWQKEALDPTKP